MRKQLAEEYIYILGEIRAFAFGFVPQDWLACEGQLLPVTQYANLYSLLGTTYGGDGISTFGLPDLRGRMIIDKGTGPGLTTRRLGDKGGQETVITADANTNADSTANNSMPPFLTLNYCICVEGQYPIRK
jgi:microcystin-dependent protein